VIVGNRVLHSLQMPSSHPGNAEILTFHFAGNLARVGDGLAEVAAGRLPRWARARLHKACGTARGPLCEGRRNSKSL
jgi:hypothetical protein